MPTPFTKEQLSAFTKVPVENISDAAFNKVLEMYTNKATGPIGDLKNKIIQGYDQTIASNAMALGFPQTAAQYTKAASQVPIDTDMEKQIQDISDPNNTYGQAAYKFITNPKAAAGILASSLPASAGMMLASTPATALEKGIASKAVGAVLAGTESAMNEYGSTVLQTLSDLGVDVTKGEDIQKVMADPELRGYLNQLGAERGIPVGAFDGIAFGLAGKFVSNKALNPYVAHAGEIGMQAASGAAGEGSAQLASEGKITNPAAITIEALSEAATGIPEAYIENAMFHEGDTSDKYNKYMSRIPEVAGQDINVTEDTNQPPIVPTVQPSAIPDTLTDNNARKAADISSGNDSMGARTIARQEAPKEILRGTYEQSKSRLLRLSKQDLIDRATLNDIHTPEELTNLTKEAIANSILDKYGIKPKSKEVQTPTIPEVKKQEQTQLSDTTKEPVAPNVEEKQNIIKQGLEDEGTRKALETLAQGTGRTAEAARAWLAHQDAQAQTKVESTPSPVQINKTETLSSDPTIAAMQKMAQGTGRMAETARAWLNQQNVTQTESNEVTPNVSTVQETTTPIDTPSFVNTSKPRYSFGQKGFGLSFESPVDKALFIAAQKAKSKNDSNFRSWLANEVGIPEEEIDTRAAAVKEAIKQLAKTSNPAETPILNIPTMHGLPNKKIAQPVAAPVKDIVQAKTPAKKEVSVLDRIRNEAPKGLDTNIAEPKVQQEKNIAVPEWNYRDKLNGVEDSTAEFLTNNPNPQVKPEDFKNATQMTFLNGIFRSYDMFRSMQSVVRQLPFMADMNLMWRDKQAFRHNISQQAKHQLAYAARKYGSKRIDLAYKILDTMSRPTKDGNQAQSIKPQVDGRIRFIDYDGKAKLADKQTSDAIRDLSNINKQLIAVQMKSVLADLSDYGIDAQNSTREDIIKQADAYKAVGNDQTYNAIMSGVTLLDKLNQLINSDVAYYPHVRAEGPYAIATYRKDEDGELVLAGLYSVKATKSGAVDAKHLKEIRNKIAADQTLHKEVFYSANGSPATQASPFYKNRDNIRNIIMKNAKDTKLAHEMLASILSIKEVDANSTMDVGGKVNQVLDSMSLRDNIEKMFLFLRERKGYLGYDNEDYIKTMVNYFDSQAAVMSNYRYNPRLAKNYAQINSHLATKSYGKKVQKTVDAYYNYLMSPEEAATAVRSASFWYFLAGNPSTSFLQLFSTHTNTLPWMAQYVNTPNFIKANFDSIFNYGIVSRMYLNRFLLNSNSIQDFAKKTKLPIEDAKMFLRLKNEGILDPGYGVEMIGDANLSSFDDNRRTNKALKLAKNKLRGITETSAALISVPEEIARMNTALLVNNSLKNPKQLQRISDLLYRTDDLFRKTVDTKYGGKVTKEAIIRHAIDENHGVFGKAGRPEFIRGVIGSTAFPFTTYPIQMMEQLGRLMTERGPEGRRAFAMMALVYPVMFGGLLAIPGYDMWDWMTKWYKKLADKENTTLEIVLSRAMMDLGIDDSATRRTILSGPILNNLMNVDASARINNQFWFQPLLDTFAGPDQGFAGQNKAYDLAGGLGSVANGIKATANNIAEGDPLVPSMVKNLAPSPIKNAMKAWDIYNGDYETQNGKRLLPKDDPRLDMYNAAVRLMGFQPSAISEASKFRYMTQIQNDAYKDAFAGYNNLIARHFSDMKQAQKDKNLVAYEDAKKKTAEAVQELIKFNANLGPQDRKPRQKLLSDMQSTVKNKYKEDAAPLTERQGNRKSRSIKKDVHELALPEIEGDVKERK